MPIKLVLMLLFLFVIIFRGSSAPSDGLTLCRGRVGTFKIKRHKLQICYHFSYFCFLWIFLLWYHSSCCIKDRFTVRSFNFKVWYWRLYWSRSTKDPVDSHWFVVVVLPSQVFRNLNPERAPNSYIRPLSCGFTDRFIFGYSLELFWAKWKLRSFYECNRSKRYE